MLGFGVCLLELAGSGLPLYSDLSVHFAALAPAKQSHSQSIKGPDFLHGRAAHSGTRGVGNAVHPVKKHVGSRQKC